MIAEVVLMQMIDEVRGANGNRRGVIKRWADLLQKSEKSIYRILKDRGFGCGRKKRCDKGKINGVTEDQLRQVAAILFESWTEKYRKPIMPAWKAIEMAERSDIIEKGSLSEHKFNRWLRNNNISKKDISRPTPHVEMRSLFPNHMHQYDVSVCAQWYLKDDGSIGHQRRNVEVYKNKPGKPRQLKRHVIVDHFSGAFFVMYFESENVRDSLEFLLNAWMRKSCIDILDSLGLGERGQTRPQERPVSDPGFYGRLEMVCERFIFRGVPKILYTDKGSAIKSGMCLQLFKRLGIEYLSHEKELPRALGSGETHMWIWERAFESELKLKPARSLLELNVRAMEYAIKFQSEKRHTRHGRVRFAAWNSIKGDQLRDLPEDRDVIRSLAMRGNEERNVDYKGYIFYNNNKYLVPGERWRGERVLVGPDIFHPGNIVVEHNGEKICLAPLKMNAWGFSEKAVTWGDFKRPSDTDTMREVKSIAEIDLGKKKFADIDFVGMTKFANKIGKEIDVGDKKVERIYGRIEAKLEVISRLGYRLQDWQINIMDERLKIEDGEITEDIIGDIMMRIERRDVDFG